MDMDDVSARIRGLRFMPRLGDALQEKVADIFQRASVPRSIPAGGVFIHQGEHVDNKGYILLQGAVVVRKDGFPDVVCKPPELIGEIMQFNPAGTRTATCAGAVESIVLRFKWDEFWADASTSLSESEMETLREALENEAWEHFLR